MTKHVFFTIISVLGWGTLWGDFTVLHDWGGGPPWGDFTVLYDWGKMLYFVS